MAAAARLPRRGLRNLAIPYPTLRLLVSALIRALAAFTPRISVGQSPRLKHNCGGIHINGGNTVTFGSGLYVIDGAESRSMAELRYPAPE